MKLIFTILTVITCIPLYAQSDSAFTDLKGFQDKNGHVFLYYRINESQHIGNQTFYSKNVYCFDLQTQKNYLKYETVGDYYDQGIPFTGSYHGVSDFEFWGGDTSNSFFATVGCGIDCVFMICRESEKIEYLFSYLGICGNLEVSQQDSNMILSSWGSTVFITYTAYYASQDSNIGFRILDFDAFAIFPNNDSLLLAVNNIGLHKSYDRGNTFTPIANSLNWNILKNGKPFIFSSDGKIIYSVLDNYPSYQLAVSKDFGESWEITYSDSSRFFISIDNHSPEQIYISRGKEILKSEDYGKTIKTFQYLTQPISGIYKKPNDELVYAITPNFLLEVSSASVKILSRFYTEIDSRTDKEFNLDLYQNYPNPFNPDTKIEFSIPAPSRVKIIIYDVLGKQIEILSDNYFQAGTHQVQFIGKSYPSGTYFYSLEFGSTKLFKKMILIK